MTRYISVTKIFLDSLRLFEEIAYYNHKINIILYWHRIKFPRDMLFTKV